MSWPARTARLVSRTALRPFAAMERATRSTSSRSSSCGTTRLTRPMRGCFLSVDHAPGEHQLERLRRDRSARGSRWVPPNPGVMPRDTSGALNLARSEAIRISQDRTTSMPPPSAKPLTAAMVGWGRFSSLSKTRWALVERAYASAGRHVPHLGDVGTGDERLVAGAGDDDHAHRVVGGDLVEHLAPGP